MSYYGVSGARYDTLHQNVKKTWDTLLHEQVINKSAWKGLTGVDKGGEEDQNAELANKPIVLKTQLGKEAGDQITMSLNASNVKQAWLNGTDTNNWFNMGKSGNVQLVDSEDALTFYNLKVKVGHQRFGTVVDGKISLQQMPFDIRAAAKNRLAAKMTYFLDTSPFFAIYAGYSPNVIRDTTTDITTGVAHPNQIYGNGQAALTDVSATDTLTTNSLEIIRIFWETANINPIIVDGEAKALLFVHPYNGKTLRADSAWVDAQVMGMPRGNDNPVFQNATGQWGGIVVRESNKISTEFNPAAITVTSGELTGTGGDNNFIDAPTMGAGIDATKVYMCTLVGANAVARAFALESYMERRKEDDYGNIYGFGGGFIHGDRRADFALSQDSGSDGSAKNQSSAICHFYAASVTVPTVW